MTLLYLPWRDGEGDGGGVADPVNVDDPDLLTSDDIKFEELPYMSGLWNDGNKTSMTIVNDDKI